MLSVNEIREVTFNKSMSGYKTAEVDVFIDQCAETAASLTKANAELEKKLEVLADKLVEYRNEEDSIRTALLSAQRLGDTIVKDANHKAELILEDAKSKAEKINETAQRSIMSEKQELERIKKEVSSFKAHLLSIYREHLAMVDIMPEVDKQDSKQSLEEVVPNETETPVQIEQSEKTSNPIETEAPTAEDAAAQQSVVMNIPTINDADSDEPETDTVSKVPDEEKTDLQQAPVSENRFTNLKFGEDYDISKDEDDSSNYFKRRK